MRNRTFAFAAALVIAASAVQLAQTRQQSAARSGYQMPPKAIVDILDAPPIPTVVVGPDLRTIAVLSRRSMPTIAELAEPIYRIAGARINARTNGRQQRGGAIISITLKSIANAMWSFRAVV